METRRLLFATAVLLLAPAVKGATYRCQSGTGKPAFSDKPADGCTPIELKVVQPSPAEAAIALERLRRDRAEEAAKAEAARRAKQEQEQNSAQPTPPQNPDTE